MLVVTHELTALQDVVDHIIEMDAGQVSFDGSPDGYTSHLQAVTRQTHRGGNHHDEVDSRAHHLMRGPYDTTSTSKVEVR